MTLPPLPPGVELRDRRIADDEAEALFRSAAVLVLPYRDATQSALVAAAYAFGVPVIVTDVGALPEYVVRCDRPGETGWVVPAGGRGRAGSRHAGGVGRSRAPAPDGRGGAGVVRGAAAGRTGRAGQDVCLPVCRTGVRLR